MVSRALKWRVSVAEARRVLVADALPLADVAQLAALDARALGGELALVAPQRREVRARGLVVGGRVDLRGRCVGPERGGR